jgi:hypothetical protein
MEIDFHSGPPAAQKHWVDEEVLASEFKDQRLGKRFKMVLKQLSEATAESIPWACQDWANTKAAYLFLIMSESMKMIFCPATFARLASALLGRPRRS